MSLNNQGDDNDYHIYEINENKITILTCINILN